MTDLLRILIIDDSMEDRETYKRYLSSIKMGKILFLECETGEDGLDLLENKIVDCIILDYNLPDTDGIEILTRLSQKKDFSIPVIFLTGQGNEMVAVQAMKNGAMDYLIKSAMTKDLLNRSVRYAIEKKRTGLKLDAYVKELEQANLKIMEQQKSIIEEERLKVILQMAGTTAHELNQPLMVLLNAIELMEMDRGAPDELEKQMTLVTNAGQKIADIVRKIQEVQHYETQPYAGGGEIIKLGQSLNILVVEDSDKDFDRLKAVLDTIEDTTVFRTEDLDQGYEKLKKERIDLIFLDYFLPSGTALDFISHIHQKRINIPVIVVTLSDDEMIASRTIQAGADDYLPKSKISSQTITRVIKNTLSRFKARQELCKNLAQVTTHD